MKRLTRLAAVAGVALLLASGAAAAAECAWTGWQSFRDHFVSDGGRVIDPSTDGQTTSEGQSYAMFFALVANDPATFAKLLRWTEDNLAGGDLTARLPAWQWGKRSDGTWGVIDDNAAADSDLWIAYNLAEASRLWKNARYAAMAELLAMRIAAEETADLPGLGRTLLPGPKGFTPQPGVWKLNPSYVPLQLMRRMAALYPKSEWSGMVVPARDLIVRSAPRGFAPEWPLYRADGGFQPDPETRGKGSFNAIRVYLWAGMLADDDPLRESLLKTLAPMADAVAANGAPPLEADSRDGSVEGSGPVGFSAAVLPFLVATKKTEAARQQRLRIDAKAPLEKTDNYYDQVLTLFGQGWQEGRYRFARDGALRASRTCAKN